jgi:FAD/FMN-containing dehydrogenase
MITVSNSTHRIPPLFQDVAKMLHGDIDCSYETLQKYTKDLSPFFITPQAVVYPKNPSDIKHILSFSREYKIPVTVRGKGIGGNGGALGEGVIIDMSRYFTRMRSVNLLENTVTAEAGFSVEELLERLHPINYDIPLLSKKDPSTVGGLIATNGATFGTFSFGSLRDWIESITIVTDEGEEHILKEGITPHGRLLGIYQALFPLLTEEAPLLRAHKPLSHVDGSGYRIWDTSIGPRQLIDEIIGSEGTLAIITSATFRITHKKSHTGTIYIPLHNKKDLEVCIREAKNKGGEKMFLYDETFMQLAQKYRQGMVPFFSETPYVLALTFSGKSEASLQEKIESYLKKIPVEAFTIKYVSGIELFETITEKGFLFSLCEDYTRGAFSIYSGLNDLVVTSPQIKEALLDIENYLHKKGLPHILTGAIDVGNISITLLFDKHNEHYGDTLLRVTQDICAIIKEYKGGVSMSSGEGLMRTPFLSYSYSDQIINLFKKIKNVWDPLGVLNPGKKVGASLTYLKQHIVQK